MKSKYDVLVIGGGVIGLACAHYLVEAGRNVCLIEKDQIVTGASHGNCGLIFTSDLVPLTSPGAVRKELALMLRGKSELYIGFPPDLARIRWLLKFASHCTNRHMQHATAARKQLLSRSAQLYQSLFETEELEADRECNGVLMVYARERGWRDYAETNELLRPHGYHAEPVRGNALAALEPALKSHLYGAWHHPRDSHLRPDMLLESWRRLLLRRGAVIRENMALTDFHRAGGEISAVGTSQGIIRADHYVLAAGVWSPSVLRPLGVSLPIEPGKGYSITMAAPPGGPRIPCYLHEKRTVATPWRSGYRLGGIMEISGHNTRLDTRRISHLRTVAAEYLKTPLGDPVHEEWTGMRPMTYDELPIIGRAAQFSNLFLATGHGMLGLSTAPGTGELIAELIAGEKPHLDPAPFRASRF
jgi:D-amino-acid dehydrogenase